MIMIARTSTPKPLRRRMILADGDSAHAAASARHFRRQGWEVHLAVSGPNARQLVHMLAPEVVVLDTQLPGESGWLTCAKITLIKTDVSVVLVSSEATEEEQRLAEAVGAAALVNRENGVPRFEHDAACQRLPHAV
jgi:sigma-B regulation protein RsbU (phosphoserine phosphatase)